MYIVKFSRSRVFKKILLYRLIPHVSLDMPFYYVDLNISLRYVTHTQAVK